MRGDLSSIEIRRHSLAKVAKNHSISLFIFPRHSCKVQT